MDVKIAGECAVRIGRNGSRRGGIVRTESGRDDREATASAAPRFMSALECSSARMHQSQGVNCCILHAAHYVRGRRPI